MQTSQYEQVLLKKLDSIFFRRKGSIAYNKVLIWDILPDLEYGDINFSIYSQGKVVQLFRNSRSLISCHHGEILYICYIANTGADFVKGKQLELPLNISLNNAHFNIAPAYTNHPIEHNYLLCVMSVKLPNRINPNKMKKDWNYLNELMRRWEDIIDSNLLGMFSLKQEE